MQIEKLSNQSDITKYLKALGVDGGGVSIMADKAGHHILYIRNLHVGAANILKQDALSIGADLAVPRGTVVASVKYVDCILIATHKQLKILSKKELAQPFGLKEFAHECAKIVATKKSWHVELMGVLNANDDSFFATSRFSEKNALHAMTKMIEDGADSIDIGAVSSRPNSVRVTPEEEFGRIKNILDAIKTHKLYEDVAFSIDSYEPKVISYALEAGFSIVNDITGLVNDEVSKLCASYGAKAVIMHMQGTPQTMQHNPSYEHILSDMTTFFKQRVGNAEALGVKDIILDVGIGFGKTLQDNLTLIKHLEHFLRLKKPLLVGASRKSMIDAIMPSSVEERLPGTLALHMQSVTNGASVIRAHDVKEHAQALAVLRALDETL